LERLKTIIKTWLSNDVLRIEERKDDEGKTREFMAAGSFKNEAPAYSDDEWSRFTTGGNCRATGDANRFKGPIFPPVRQFRQSP
jgi:hypothetical protein